MLGKPWRLVFLLGLLVSERRQCVGNLSNQTQATISEDCVMSLAQVVVVDLRVTRIRKILPGGI